MGIRISPDEFPLMRDAIEQISGIRVGDGKAYLIESRLGKVLAEYGCDSFRAFHMLLKARLDADLRSKVINAMSTQETLWFRDTHPFRIFSEKLMPAFQEEVRGGRRQRVRIWSAASSTGQEAYSLAMLVLDAQRTLSGVRPETYEIIGTDIASSAVMAARNGLYDRIAMGRGLGPEYRQRYFVDDGRYCRVTDEVRRLVSFREFNLRESFAGLGRFDIVLCRNVAIYFSDTFKQELYAKIHAALAPGGILFLGSSESISAYSTDYDLLDYKGGIYYRAKAAPGAARLAA
jgi:chemotaxis protein methyltransferase CheR